MEKEHSYKRETLTEKEQSYITQLCQQVIDRRKQVIWGKEAAGFLTGKEFRIIERDDGTLTIRRPYEIATDLHAWEFLAQHCDRGKVRETGFIQITTTRVRLGLQRINPTQVKLIPSPTEDMKSGKTTTVDNPLPLSRLTRPPIT